MSADLNYEFSLPAAPKNVFAMLTGSDYLSDKASNAIAGKYESTGTLPDVQIRITRTLDGELPEMVKKFVGEILTVVEIQDWTQPSKDDYLATVELKINNAPVEIAGSISLAGKQTTQVLVRLKVKVNLPIFGALAEPQVIQKLKTILQDEELLCAKWISK